jgi:small subunit ribosomal protein S13
MFGLKVRGQCTRTTGRRGGAVGVKKIGKALPTVPSAQPATQAAAGGEAPATGNTTPPPQNQ